MTPPANACTAAEVLRDPQMADTSSQPADGHDSGVVRGAIPSVVAPRSEDVRDEHLRCALVGRVSGGEELGHVAFLDDGAVEKIGAEYCDRAQPVRADRYRRTDHAEDDAAV